MSLYSQLLQKALEKLDKPVSESTFVDYGGGCGMLSYLAREAGFKTVVYNDIYPQSVSDTRVIARNLGLTIDFYITGDIQEFVHGVHLHQIKPDLICSFDVIEHIYDTETWFKTIQEINGHFSILFMSAANPRNPFVARRLKKLQVKAEQNGSEKIFGWKEIDLNSSFLEARREIIRSKHLGLENSEIESLALKTRGLRKDDILDAVDSYLKTGELGYCITHPTNTCDPYTGNWTENLIDLKKLKDFLKQTNFDVKITNSLYGYSGKSLLNTPKLLLNQLIKLAGPEHLMLSPTYTLEVQKL
jgi:hypothetical protein